MNAKPHDAIEIADLTARHEVPVPDGLPKISVLIRRDRDYSRAAERLKAAVSVRAAAGGG
jgi:hypothetical protein